MEVNIKEIVGSWNLGYSLDKHTLHSTPIGHNQWGHMQFDTVRPDAGEALYQLKYRNDFSQAPIIAEQMHISLGNAFSTANLVVPMPPSKNRVRQPVTEIARELSQLMGIPCYEELLIKTKNTTSMKDISSIDEKISTLIDAFSINDLLANGYVYDVLLVDDLYDTGSSLEAATQTLRQYAKIRNIYVATVTRKR